MTKPENAKLARQQLDARLRDGSIRELSKRPPRGWIRAVRDALGMSSRQLAARMGQTQSAVTQLEHSEVNGSARLESLRRAAAALDCDLVYALVPRTTLDHTVRDQARTLATEDLAGIHRSMQLEDQALSDVQLDERVDDYAARLIAEGRLWGKRGGAR
ncbi:MAG: mobile mystery protein [Actinomycetia bacterium]|nr:mobile mystery protein [Actinomycetes bacterium]